MTHNFIINTERVNEYGYRILTRGIDTEQYERNPVVLFGHVRGFSDPKKVIGKCVALKKKGTDLIATIEFDTADEFAKEVAGKVERGFIRMASLYADVIETSVDEELILPGQTLETVTKCKLVEISIVDIGGNDDALKLSRNGSPIKLNKLTKVQKQMSLKTIALAMGLNENADSGTVIKEYSAMKLAKEKAEKEAISFENELKEIKGVEADALVEKAVSLGLVPKELKDIQRKAFDSNFVEQKAVLSKLITEKEETNKENGKQEHLREIILNDDKTKEGIKLTFDYLQKYDVSKLREIRDKQPEEYARLAKEYAAGVRHKD